MADSHVALAVCALQLVHFSFLYRPTSSSQSLFPDCVSTAFISFFIVFFVFFVFLSFYLVYVSFLCSQPLLLSLIAASLVISYAPTRAELAKQTRLPAKQQPKTQSPSRPLQAPPKQSSTAFCGHRSFSFLSSVCFPIFSFLFADSTLHRTFLVAPPPPPLFFFSFFNLAPSLPCIVCGVLPAQYILFQGDQGSEFFYRNFPFPSLLLSFLFLPPLGA